MAAVRNLGLFPNVVFCARKENPTLDSALADIWIQSTPAFLYALLSFPPLSSVKLLATEALLTRSVSSLLTFGSWFCSSLLMRQGMDREEAIEYFDYNIAGALSVTKPPYFSKTSRC